MAPPIMHDNGMSATGSSQQSSATPASTMSSQQTMRTPTMGRQQPNPATGIPSSWNPSERQGSFGSIDNLKHEASFFRSAQDRPYDSRPTPVLSPARTYSSSSQDYCQTQYFRESPVMRGVLPAMQKSPPRSASTHSPEGSRSLPSLQTTFSGLSDPGINGIHAPSPYAPSSRHSPQFVRHLTFSSQSIGPSPGTYSPPYPGISPPAIFNASDPALFTVYPLFGGDEFNRSHKTMGDDFAAWLFNDVPLSQTGAAAQDNQPGVLPYRRHTGTLSKSPDDEMGVVDLGQRRSPFLREGRLFDLPLLLGDQEILAVPDTGAQINAISVQTLKRLRGQFQSQWGSLDDTVNIANSSSTDAICQVTIDCRLTQASLVAQFYPNCVFHVFSELASGVMAIIGRAFLDVAQILTTRSYLLRERVDHLQCIPRCLSIGPLKSSGLRLPVYLDSKLITAFPDTGSEIDLISRACALLHRFDIQQLQVTDESVVQFADGRIDTLSGKVRVKFDTFTEPVLSTRSTLSTKRDESAPLLTPSSKRRKTSGTAYLDVASSAPPDHHRTFYVLDSLPYDVVLSQFLLHSIDAFNLHSSGFTTVTSEENKKEICTIFWYRGKEYRAEETLQECQQREAARRTKVRLAREKIEKKIQKTPASDIVRRDQLRQDLGELRRQNEEETEKYNAEVQALLTSSPTREQEDDVWAAAKGLLTLHQLP